MTAKLQRLQSFPRRRDNHEIQTVASPRKEVNLSTSRMEELIDATDPKVPLRRPDPERPPWPGLAFQSGYAGSALAFLLVLCPTRAAAIPS